MSKRVFDTSPKMIYKWHIAHIKMISIISHYETLDNDIMRYHSKPNRKLKKYRQLLSSGKDADQLDFLYITVGM